ncbi:MAG: septal ring lytic transglycosylase RlpA family protein [Burkholderiales bacterium]|jgi:rare lipoprotein A|nr:septal ring lytic transglycosylase RlpA family protein [Burkholderiales bacterium]
MFRSLSLCLMVAMTLTACSSTRQPAGERGGYYQDDGPGSTAVNLDNVPDAVPRAEPLHRFANRPYTVLGRTYVPATTRAPYKARGAASWYGKKFHGQKTSTGEIYDMFAMSAAHPTLPLPSYVRVTSLANGKSVVVRVNDRGPFLHNRLIDLSYAAAHRIGIAAAGTGEVEVEAILSGAPAAVAPVSGVVSGTVSPPADAAVQAVGGGVIVQLGVFGNYANAEAFLAHVQGTLDTARISARIQQRDDGKYRVFVGPYPQRAEAQQAAAHLNEALGLTTFVTAH